MQDVGLIFVGFGFGSSTVWKLGSLRIGRRGDKAGAARRDGEGFVRGLLQSDVSS